MRGPPSRPRAEHPGEEAEARQRIDRWLWSARLVKTRSGAAALAQSGRIRLSRAGAEGVRVSKPSLRLMTGDVLTVPHGRDVKVVEVRQFVPVRGKAAAAQTLYTDLTPGEPNEGAPMRNRDPGGMGPS